MVVDTGRATPLHVSLPDSHKSSFASLATPLYPTHALTRTALRAPILLSPPPPTPVAYDSKDVERLYPYTCPKNVLLPAPPGLPPPAPSSIHVAHTSPYLLRPLPLRFSLPRPVVPPAIPGSPFLFAFSWVPGSHAAVRNSYNECPRPAPTRPAHHRSLPLPAAPRRCPPLPSAPPIPSRTTYSPQTCSSSCALSRLWPAPPRTSSPPRPRLWPAPPRPAPPLDSTLSLT
ncbi:hypothetical protein DFH09DRAFT_1339457 [Mycena vulgaris]|nr:hypothetical protein DFH09DRAFT_1339457 [Mycena vulgaris]